MLALEVLSGRASPGTPRSHQQTIQWSLTTQHLSLTAPSAAHISLTYALLRQLGTYYPVFQIRRLRPRQIDSHSWTQDSSARDVADIEPHEGVTGAHCGGSRAWHGTSTDLVKDLVRVSGSCEIMSTPHTPQGTPQGN